MPCKADTIVKLRVLSRNQQLLRMDFEQSPRLTLMTCFFATRSSIWLMLIW